MNKLAKRFQEIAKHPNTEIVAPFNYKVSQNPLYSDDYSNCNGVVLLNHSVGGLSHYALDL